MPVLLLLSTSQNENKHLKEVLSSLLWNKLNAIILAQLNINSIQNKLDLLSEWITGRVAVFMIDDAFPSIQCTIAEYAAPYRLDRN